MIKQLSIIIPTLNEEHYLPRLLESLAAQTFGGTTEIIVVDGIHACGAPWAGFSG